MSKVSYDPDTGEFVGVRGWAVGWVDDSTGGYIRVKYKGVQVLAHRLAWFLYYGEWPDGELDHIDRNPLNNRIDNLRLADRSLNCRNSVGYGRNGIKGVQDNRGSVNRPYQATIGVDRKVIRLGTFGTKREAAQARYDAEIKYGDPIEASAAKKFLGVMI